MKQIKEVFNCVRFTNKISKKDRKFLVNSLLEKRRTYLEKLSDAEIWEICEKKFPVKEAGGENETNN